jgi:hypothetical protein
MPSQHVITEDYDHYVRRKREENKRALIFGGAVIAIILIVAFALDVSSRIKENKQQQEAAQLLWKCEMTEAQIISVMNRNPDSKEASIGNSFALYYEKVDSGSSLRFDLSDGKLISIFAYPPYDRNILNYRKYFGCSLIEGKWIITTYSK